MLLNEDKTLNKNIPIPLYYQLKTLLLEYIKASPVDSETPIPTEVEISAHFGISRPTVRQAINELVVEGYLYRIKAKGTFITKPKIKQDFLQTLDSFNNEFIKNGMTTSAKILHKSIEKSDEKVSDALKIPLNTKTIKLDRLGYANNEPIVFVTTYLPYAKCSSLMSRNLEAVSIYRILEKEYGFSIARASRSLESILAGEYEAGLLEIDKGSPVQYFESITYLEDNTPIEYSFAKYRGDRNKFVFELKRNPQNM